MKRFGLLLGALALAVALSSTSASAHWHHGWHGHGWYGHHWGWHHGWGWRGHPGGSPVRVGPHCWVNTDDSRGFGYYKWCDDRRWRHHRHWHRWHRWG